MVIAAFYKPQPRPGDQVLYRARHPDFTRISAFRYARSNVDADAGDAGAAQLDFRCVHAATHFEIRCASAVTDGAAAAHGTCRSVKRRDDAVTCGVDEATGILLDLGEGGTVKATQRSRPPAITQSDHLASRVDNIDEENGG